MESNFQKISNAVTDLKSIKEISDEDKFTLIGCYAQELMKNVELKKELDDLQKEKRRVEAQLWI